MLRGVDVSSLVDWASLKATHGLSFGFARCMRETEAKDVTFDENWSRMGELPDFVRGAYVFASPAPGSDAVEDAQLFWDYLISAGPLWPTDLFCLDLEKSVLGQDDTNVWARAWFDEFVRIADRLPGIYMGSGYLTNRTGAGLKEHGFNWLWFPRYSSTTFTWPTSFNPQPLGTTWTETNWGQPPEFWQFFGTNTDSPVTFDGNVYNGTLDQLQALNGGVMSATGPEQWDANDWKAFHEKGLEAARAYKSGEVRAWALANYNSTQASLRYMTERAWYGTDAQGVLAGKLFNLGDAELAAIAKAVNDEIARRQQA